MYSIQIHALENQGTYQTLWWESEMAWVVRRPARCGGVAGVALCVARLPVFSSSTRSGMR
eukprot:COSAG02_NODE_14385_length_1277_cov_5.361630_1_plen_59_part_10